MQLEVKDKGYLWDMLDAARDIRAFISGMQFHEFENNKVVRFAVERQLLVIGEAANRVSNSAKKNLPSIPWKPIVGLRNIIAHEYGEILTANIWKVSVQDVPLLVRELEELV